MRAIQFQPFDVSTLSEVTASFSVAEDPNLRAVILKADLRGHAFNSHEQSSFRHIESMLAGHMVATTPDGIILDLTELRYEWGDEMAGVLFYCSNHPIERDQSIPVAVVTSDINREGLTSLVRDEMLQPINEWLFSDVESAVESVCSRL